MRGFLYGRELLNLLARLANEYRTALIEKGDSEARKVFGKNEYAAKESETLSKRAKKMRTFEYAGEQVTMYRHLKIGVEDDVTKTIRVHFHWDPESEKIVIGHCGEHLPLN